MLSMFTENNALKLLLIVGCFRPWIAVSVLAVVIMVQYIQERCHRE